MKIFFYLFLSNFGLAIAGAVILSLIILMGYLITIAFERRNCGEILSISVGAVAAIVVLCALISFIEMMVLP